MSSSHQGLSAEVSVLVNQIETDPYISSAHISQEDVKEYVLDNRQKLMWNLFLAGLFLFTKNQWDRDTTNSQYQDIFFTVSNNLRKSISPLIPIIRKDLQ